MVLPQTSSPFYSDSYIDSHVNQSIDYVFNRDSRGKGNAYSGLKWTFYIDTNHDWLPSLLNRPNGLIDLAVVAFSFESDDAYNTFALTLYIIK